MNNLIFPPADRRPDEIAAMICAAMQNHENYHKGVLLAVAALHRLDLHTLQFLRAKLKESKMRYQSPKGRDFEQGENYAFARIDEVLANAIELAGGPNVKPKYTDPLIWLEKKPEPEIPWDALPDWAQWVAMDNDGEWWEYEEEPRQLQTVWENLVHTCAKKTSLIPFTAPDWRTSLRQRPAKTTAP